MRALAAAAAALLAAGCAAAPVPAPGVNSYGRITAQALADDLAADVEAGFKQIFKTYDDRPQDDRLSFDEFKRVVVLDWFAEHDANNDGYLLLSEWLTPAEVQLQVAGIKASGVSHVKRADTDGDQRVSLAEHMAFTQLEIDPTPWLAGPADPDVRANAFKRWADPATGQLDADRAARMLGALLAYGYYLDDGTEAVRRRLKP